MLELNKIYNADCLELMKEIPDKSIDLVLTDPPYGIDYGNQLIKGEQFTTNTNKHGWRNFGNAEWDRERPSEEIFKEIFRISKNQIIWGGELFFRPAVRLSVLACMGQGAKRFFFGRR